MNTTGETHLSQKYSNYSRSKPETKTVTMDQEKKVQWIQNYSKLYESESMNQSSRKTERILRDILDLCYARKTPVVIEGSGTNRDCTRHSSMQTDSKTELPENNL